MSTTIAMRRVRVAAALLLVLAASAAATAPLTPEETVRRYLRAVKDRKFGDAYDLVSKAMRGGKEREVWVKESEVFTASAEVKIFSFEVHPGKIEGDKAYVPNLLSSQDRFVNQLGLPEHELYTLVKEEGTWRVDQQVIVEPPDVPKWFPPKGKDGGGGAPAAEPGGAGASPGVSPGVSPGASPGVSPGVSPGASHLTARERVC